MLWVADLIEKMLRDIFGYDSGWTQSKNEFVNAANEFTTFISDLIEYLKNFINLLRDFISPFVFNFLTLCLTIWVIIIVYRIVKGFLFGGS